VVTDLAARGLDIPLVNNVINFDFPDRAKLFVHRVGRAARQGRSGTAYSLATSEELAHLVDVFLYLGRCVADFLGWQRASNPLARRPILGALQVSSPTDTHMGQLPQDMIDAEVERIEALTESDPVLSKLRTGADNARKMFMKTRSEPSKRSVKRFKEEFAGSFPVHGLFQKWAGKTLEARPGDIDLNALAAFKVCWGGGATNPRLSRNGPCLRLRARKRATARARRGCPKWWARSSELGIRAGPRGRGRAAWTSERRTAQSRSTWRARGPNRRRTLPHTSRRLRVRPAGRSATRHSTSRMKAAARRTKPVSRTSSAWGRRRASRTRCWTWCPTTTRALRKRPGRSNGTSAKRHTCAQTGAQPLPRDKSAADAPRRWRIPQVQATMADHVAAKRAKNESGTAIRPKDSGQLYERWQQRTKRSIAHGAEDGSTNVHAIAAQHRQARKDKAGKPGERKPKEELKSEDQFIKESRKREADRERCVGWWVAGG
jgi:superfamily II DNA/RNA helicase